jgi:hypothetical protein
MNPLLKNAVVSIQLGIETFKTPRLFQGVDLQLGALGRPAGSARALSCSEILRFKNIHSQLSPVRSLGPIGRVPVSSV